MLLYRHQEACLSGSALVVKAAARDVVVPLKYTGHCSGGGCALMPVNLLDDATIRVGS